MNNYMHLKVDFVYRQELRSTGRLDGLYSRGSGFMEENDGISQWVGGGHVTTENGNSSQKHMEMRLQGHLFQPIFQIIFFHI